MQSQINQALKKHLENQQQHQHHPDLIQPQFTRNNPTGVAQQLNQLHDLQNDLALQKMVGDKQPVSMKQ